MCVCVSEYVYTFCVCARIFHCVCACVYIYTCTHTMKYSVKKMNAILSFATTWMKLEGIMLREKIRQKQMLYELSYMCILKKNKKPKLIDTEEIGGCQSWRMKGERNT